ncbi:MAG TPA: enolase C-terminal domain-like protein [Acidimicrobiales bacterium]|nr:MAG: hypothetical protein B7Z69_04395 [Actinobacteria bacterium 21-73-9]HQU26705.1 enolase C-terminal domain-like protein [Acidimicrobiales bacterium]
MRARIYRTEVALLDVVEGGAQTHASRPRLYLELELDGVTGFGEVAPQPVALNGDPGVDEVIVAAHRALARVREWAGREGVPPWWRVGVAVDGTPAARAAAALVEMALVDRELRATGRTLADLWPARHEVRTTATVSLLSSAPWRVSSGAARVRAKCAPGPLAPEALERLEALEVPVLLDYNATALDAEGVLDRVREVARRARIAALEQPFAPGNLAETARLAERLDEVGVAVSLDEGVRTLSDLRGAARYRAATVVCVKPARVGGLAQALSLIERARGLGLTPYLGGFFESPYARAVHRALVAHAVDEPSDVADVAVPGPPEAVAASGSVGLWPSPETLAGAGVLEA